MNIDIWLFGGFAVFLILLFLIMYFKDVESTKKFERFARAIEDLNQQNHQLRHALAHKKEEDKVWLDEIKLEFHKKVQDEINTKVMPLLGSLQEIEGVIGDFKDDQLQRIGKLEERTKSINSLSSNATTSHEKDVIRLFNSGKNAYSIAKNLRIGVGEVEFILKMHNLS